MNRYDKEEIIISDFQNIRHKDIILMPSDMKTLSILNTIHDKRKWKKWVDSSSKKLPPPDFYNDNLKIMMDVMRIDDHTHIDEKGNIVNPYNQRESELVKELIGNNSSFKEVADKGHLLIIPYTGLSTDEDHNYNYYVDTFKRVVNNHIKKIENYKKNHPGYIMVFFVFDESSPYARCIDGKKHMEVGERFRAQPHLWWFDKNMIECLKGSDIDYLIWMTPYKHFESDEKVRFPEALLFDVKKINYNELLDYNPVDMQSLER